MTHSLKASRRTVLQLLAGAPLIPVAGLTSLSTFFGESARAATAAAMPTGIEFVAMAAPSTPQAQATTTVESSLVLTYADGRKQSFKLAYQPLCFTGDQVPDG